MVHLRIVAPPDQSDDVHRLLCATDSVCNVVTLAGASTRPDGDVILCDVAREDASVVVSDLKDLGIDRNGSIVLQDIDTALSRAAEAAEERAPGASADAVVWEEVEARTSEGVELSATFLVFMVLAALIAASGVFVNSEILIVGAMVVGPEF